MPLSSWPVTARPTVVALLAVAFLVLAPPAASAAGPRDGSTQERAAASCWEVKQVRPAAPDGRYWILTPQLVAPVRIHCDQTTDGGGWALVGRGRDGWSWGGDGKGTPDQVSATVSGPAAFSPRQLSGRVVDGLLGGRRLDSFADHVRLRRATSTNGRSWQESRLRFASRDRWTWAFGAGHRLASYSIGGATGPVATTRSIEIDSRFKRLFTYESPQNDWVRGFTFGSGSTGTTAASSHLYSTASGGRYATPFTQVFVRPRLRTSDLSFPAVPAGGTAATTVLPLARSGALPQTWGVSGTGAGGTGETATEVQAFAQVGSRVFVGGNFTRVQKGAAATGGDVLARSYLTAFHASTGEPVRSFAPRLDGQVKALAVLPDGGLAVGGDFRTVGGLRRAGLAVLDPSTGAIDPRWDTVLENRVAGGRVSVRALAVSGGRLYVAGAFTHLVRGSSAVFARNAGRLSLATARADDGWNPNLNGTVAAMDVAPDGSRVYLAGYFTRAGSRVTPRAAALSTAAGAAPDAWTPRFSTTTTATYQQTVLRVGSRIWLGGAQHSFFAYDARTFALRDTHVTRHGGDLQSSATNGTIVYGGCHCGDWTYEGATTYDGFTPGQTRTTWRQADEISFVGAWDAATGRYLPAFTPQWKARGGFGAWALFVAADGTLWAGGSFTSVVTEKGTNQWVGGFARFAPRPSRVPSAPRGLVIARSGTSVTARWTASTTTGSTYEVLRGGRVVATTSGTSVTVPDSAAGDRFVVRASDGTGNRSASTAVAVAR